MARKYRKVKELFPVVEKLQMDGMTQKEIAKELGLANKEIVKELLKRERRKLRKNDLPKQRSRKPAVTLQQYKYENERLKMGNELLRNFLESMERK